MSANTYSSLAVLLKQSLNVFRLFLILVTAPRRGLLALFLWGYT